MFSGVKNIASLSKTLMKPSGFKRGKDYDYETDNPNEITIVFNGNKALRDRVLSSLDSSIEWGLRMTKTKKKDLERINKTLEKGASL